MKILSTPRMEWCIGCNSCQGLEALGITVDDRKNEKACEEVLEIQRDGAPVKVLAVRTNEEREIAEQTAAVLLRAREGERKSP